MPAASNRIDRGFTPPRARGGDVGLNPFVFARLALDSPQPAEHVSAALDRLLREGFEAGGRRYRLFGRRRGGYLTMSLGLPLLGGAAPVLRAWMREPAGPATFDVLVTARFEVILFGAFWIWLILAGACIQLGLQISEWRAGHASARDVLDVLPRIAIMAGLIGLPLWYLQRRGRSETRLLVTAFRDALQHPATPAHPIP